MRVGPHPALGRLLKRPDFLAAARGRRFHSPKMTVQGRARDVDAAMPATGLRLGYTVTRKVGHATERNRIKRRLRAAAAEASARFVDRHSDVVVIGRREALSAPFPDLIEDLARAFSIVTRTGGGQDTRRQIPT
ncbi:ribonuclease P protein component [uncultured Enterovirga sp.]|uniref:ribonuclease P protein component n=1 Tax=uncultured Enterovirga sp. TaxID=2026352 RepID=UPI0035CC2F64